MLILFTTTFLLGVYYLINFPEMNIWNQDPGKNTECSKHSEAPIHTAQLLPKTIHYSDF